MSLPDDWRAAFNELHKWTMESNVAELALDQTMDKYKAIFDQPPEGGPERIEAEAFLGTMRIQSEASPTR